MPLKVFDRTRLLVRPYWYAQQREKIAAAEALRDSASPREKPALVRRVVSLERNLKLGPEGLRLAASRARESRQRDTAEG